MMDNIIDINIKDNTFKVLGDTHCIYCGKLLEEQVEFDEYSKHTYYECNCDKFAKIKELDDKVSEIINTKLEYYKANKLSSKDINKVVYLKLRDKYNNNDSGLYKNEDSY